MRLLCAIGYGLSLVCVLAGAYLAVRGARHSQLTYAHLMDPAKLRDALDPTARVGVGLVVAGAFLNTAASIGSLYLPPT